MIILYYIVPGLLFCYLLPLNFGAICFWRGGSLLENVEDECTVRINKAKGATIMEASRHSDESIVVAVRPHPLFSRDGTLPKNFGPLPSVVHESSSTSRYESLFHSLLRSKSDERRNRSLLSHCHPRRCILSGHASRRFLFFL